MLENEALALAREVRGRNPGFAADLHRVLGCAFYDNEEYGRARELHEQYRAMCEALDDRAGVAKACRHIGNCYYRTNDYGRARELYEQCRALCEALGDRAGVAGACGNLGNYYFRMGDYGRARELHEQDRAMCEALGDRAGVAQSCHNLGICYYNADDYGRARVLHEQARAIDEALGNRRGVARACCNIGNCYQSTGEYARARELHEQDRAISEELGHRAGVATACGNLGLCYFSTGDYGRARELHEQARAIWEALGDREGVVRACGNIGDCCLNTGDHARAISYFTEQYEVAKGLQNQMREAQAASALGMGVALRLEVRANVRGCAVGASQLPGPHASASACCEDGVRKAVAWLQTALDFGYATASMHLARLAFDVCSEDTALGHLHTYLSWCVERGRNQCAGCDQIRDEDTQMLTCGGCRVARFCNVDHQKMASKRVASGGSLLGGRHRDVCGVLGKWRQQVVKDGMPPDVLRADLLAFLRQ